MLSFKTIYTVSDARLVAKKKLPWMVFDYFDGSAGDSLGDDLNQHEIRNLRLKTRVLRNVEQRSLKGKVFGEQTGLPFGIAPMGMCNLSTPGADLMLARMAAKHQIPVGVSTAASTPLEAMFEESDSKAWFQLYFGGDEEVSNALIDRAEASGYKVLVLTVDVAEVGRRPRELRRGFKMPFRLGLSQFIDFALHPNWSFRTLFKGAPTLANFGGSTGEFSRTSSRAGADWSFLARIRERWKGKLVIKGVLDVDDAIKIESMGIDAIQVSSHGGRQFESVPKAINALSKIRAALGDEFPIFYDSGIRNGEDVIKAYAKGADFVFLGRPFLFAMAANGERGLAEMTEVLMEEVSIALALMGIKSIEEVDQGSISQSE
jgi:L-lactate dehydrogenase (cytochrome)